MTCAIGHLGNGASILDHLTEIKAPFSPDVAVLEIADVMRRFGVTRAISDKYSGEWVKARFGEHGILVDTSAKPKSDIYRDLLPMINSGRVELLDNMRLSSQLCGLERRTSRQGKDSIDHTRDGRDDLINVAAGVLTQLDLDRRPALVKQSAMMDEGKPITLPAVIDTFVAVLCLDDKGMRAAKTPPLDQAGTRLLIILDIDSGPLHPGIIKALTDFTKFEIRCRYGTLAVVPEGFAPNGGFKSCRAIEIVDGRLPELQLLAAAMLIGEGLVKLGPLAEEKAKSLPFGGALNFRAGENIDDPLRCAILTAIHVACDEAPDTRFMKVIG